MGCFSLSPSVQEAKVACMALFPEPPNSWKRRWAYAVAALQVTEGKSLGGEWHVAADSFPLRHRREAASEKEAGQCLRCG